MSIKQQDFSLRLYDAVMLLVKKTWYKISLIYLGFTLSLYLFFILIIGIVFAIIGKSMGWENMFNNTALASALSEQLSAGGFSIVIFAIAIVFLTFALVVSSWLYYLFFLIIDEHIKKDQFIFQEVLQRSFSSTVFKLLGVSVVISFIAIIGGVLAALMAAISGWITFVLCLALFVFMLKFTLVVPHYVIGNHSWGDSFTFSMETMTIARCFKLFLLILLTYIGMVLLLMLVAFFIGGALAAIAASVSSNAGSSGSSVAWTIIAVLLQFCLQFTLVGIFVSFFLSVIMGLYYRYAHIVHEDALDIDDHLVNDAI